MNNLTQPLDFSIVLPVCHGGKFLYQSLCSLRDMDFPHHRFEVLAAGPNDDEESKKIVESEASLASYSIRYLGCSEMNRAGLLNQACSAAKGKTLAFADDDCIFFHDWLMKLEHALKFGNNIGIVGGKDEMIRNTSSFDNALDYVLNSFLGSGSIRNAQSSRIGKYYPKLWNMAIPQEVAFHVAVKTKEGIPSVFNESLIVHEDVDLASRIEQAGKRIIFDPEVRIGHFRDTTFHSFFLRNMAMARTCRSLGVHPIPHILLAVLILSLAVLVIFSLIIPLARIVMGIVAGIYVAVLLVCAFGGFKHTKRWSMFGMIPLLLFSLHLSRGLGYLFSWNNQK